MDNDGGTVAEPVRLLDASANGMAIRLSQPLSVGQTVWIADAEQTPVKAVVRQCKPARKGFEAGLFLVRIERRRSDRQPLQKRATLHWEDSRAGALSSPVVVCNVSDEGYQIETGGRVPVAIIVRLDFNAWECVGFTHYCRRIEAGKYLVGLHMTREPYPKDPNVSEE